MQTRVRFLTFICLAQFAAAATAGPFSDPGATAGEIVKFSTSVADFSPAPEGSDPSAVDAALGPPGAGFVSLGDLPEFMDTGNVDPSASPGSITLGFDGGRIFNGPGWDLAVFENATTFGGLIPDPFSFAELAYLEVSSDGIHFVRFPSISLNVEPGEGTPGDTEIDVSFGRAFATINTTNADNLAGIHETGTGTRFDLDDLAGDPLVLSGDVQLNNINFARIVDVPGDGTFLDSLGNPILDAWPTTGTGGFDLDAVGARHFVAEPAAATLALGTMAFGCTRRPRRRRKRERETPSPELAGSAYPTHSLPRKNFISSWP